MAGLGFAVDPLGLVLDPDPEDCDQALERAGARGSFLLQRVEAVMASLPPLEEEPQIPRSKKTAKRPRKPARKKPAGTKKSSRKK